MRRSCCALVLTRSHGSFINRAGGLAGGVRALIRRQCSRLQDCLLAEVRQAMLVQMGALLATLGAGEQP